MKFAFLLSLLVTTLAALSLFSTINVNANVTVTVPTGSTITTPDPPGTIRVDLGTNSGTISINGVALVNAPAGATVIRSPDGSTTVNVGGVIIRVPAGAAITTPNPPGTLRIDLGATGGTINVDGANLATASAGVSVVFNVNNTTTAIVPGGGNTSITMPTSNGPTITNNHNGTITVTLPGQSPITIPANGGQWYAVFFNSNGGSAVGAQIIESGTSVIRPPNPTRPGFILRDWYSDAALTTVWHFNANTVSNITTLTARWGAESQEAITREDSPTEEQPEVPADNPLQDEVNNEALTEDEPPPTQPSHPDEEAPEATPEAMPENEDQPEAPYTEANNQNHQPHGTNDSGGSHGSLQNNADTHIQPPQQTIFEFTLTHFDNPINDTLSHYRIISRSTIGAQYLHGNIPAFTNGDGLFYTIRYRTNINALQRIAASHIPASAPFTLLPPALTDDEFITEISIEFDTIPAGFGVGDTITHHFLVLDEDTAAFHWEVVYGEASNRNAIITAILNNIDRISNFQNRYDAASWASLQAVINAIQITLDNPNATLEALEMAYIHLQQAIDELTPAPQASPFAPASIITAATLFVLLASLIFALTKLLKHKKRLAYQMQSVPKHSI